MTTEEMLPHCDENNIILGFKPKSLVHRLSLWHRGAHLWITDGRGNVLQQFRDPSKQILPGFWDIAVAGHVSAGEWPWITVMKEAREELGLSLTSNDFQPAGGRLVNSITTTNMYIAPGNYWHRVFDYNFVMCRDINLKQLQLEKGHVADVRWYPIKKLQADLMDPINTEHACRPTDNNKLYSMAIKAMLRFN